MDLTTVSALAFVVAVIAAIGFQLALASGAPWGAYAMGGRYPGRFPPALRVAAVVQAVVLALLGVIVADRAGLLALQLAPWLIWVVVAFSGLSLAMNAVSPSGGERRLWVPVASVMFAGSLIVALVG